MDSKLIKDKKIVITSHIYATGPTHALEQYLIGHVKKLIFIGHPFVFAKERRSHIRIYNNYKKKPEQGTSPIVFNIQTINLLKDIVLNFYWIIKNGPIDLYIGADCFNGFSGVILKKLGFVKKTVFYTIDYIPNRFANKYMNAVYHWIDTFCVKHSDKVWNLSQVMVYEREKKGVSKEMRDKQIVVPMGTEGSIRPVPFAKLKRYTAVHMGHLIEKQGLQLTIQAIPDIIKKVPQFHLDIIGGGNYEDELRKMAKKLEVEKYITWYGFIKNHSEVEKMISYCAFGLAPYLNSKDNYIQYTDPGKVKAYLAAGLPIIITRMTQIAEEIHERTCGIAIHYSKKEMTESSIKLLTDDNLLKQMRKNVGIMSKVYSWENIFSKAIKNTL